MPADPIYVVTDIEADGMVVGENSMLAFASVAIGADAAEHGSFEAVLQPLPDRAPSADTMAWFATIPAAWAAATHDPQPPAQVMQRFVDWVRGLPGAPIFAAHPVAFDGGWIGHYLHRFTDDRLIQHPNRPDRLFHETLCIRSLAAGRLRWPVTRCNYDSYPADWLGNHAHTHRAIDDARGYACLLARLLAPGPMAPR